MSAIEKKTKDVFGATLSRRRFIQGGGALIVGLSLPAAAVGSRKSAARASVSLDPTRLISWLELHPDNTVTIRTGKVDMGNGTSAAYRQIVAEELNMPYEAITGMVMGSTDTTPDGGTNGGVNSGANLRKVAAYTYQALLGLASTTLGVPVANLTVANGVVSGGGKQVSYGDLVKNQQLSLTIPVTGVQDGGTMAVGGSPPLKPISQYTVIGKSFPSPMTTSIVSGATVWVASIRLPGMLHGRVVRPTTLGSTLVSVGALDKKLFPNVQVVVKGNLVGVLSPNEWEVIGAAQQVAAKTKWTDWEAMPGNGNLLKGLRSADYSAVAPVFGNANRGNVGTALAGAAKTLSATYLTPFKKHGPIGPSIAVADVRGDGTTHVWMHGQAPQLAQRMVASILNTSMSNVVVHWQDGSGHYGRSNPGPDGAEADAVLLSQAVGKPVRVQWSRQEDMQWSTSTFAVLSDVKLGLDANGNMVAYQANYYQRGRFDGRGLGALLAGTASPGGVEDGNPTIPRSKGNYSWSYGVSTQTGIYNKITNLVETGYAAAPFGQVESPYKVGMRIHSMRTPVQREENMAFEGIINEAAATVGVDPIEYRLRHTTDERLINVLNTLKQAHGWQTRSSPSPQAKATGSTPVTGRGMGVMLRSNGYHAAAADITVNPKTGKIIVDRYTIVFEGGIIVNPFRVQRNAENGIVQGLSEVLREEVAFDKGKITSTDWVSYPILRMMDLPKIKAVILSRTDTGVYAQGSEGFNSLPYVALPAALFDATGKVARTTPLRPANVRAILNA